MGAKARIGLIALQLVGLMLSAFFVVLTFASPDQVEKRLRQFAITEVERAASNAIESTREGLGDLRLDGRFDALAREIDSRADVLDSVRKDLVAALLARSQAPQCREDCAFWATFSERADVMLVMRAAELRVGGRQTLQDFVAERYESAVQGLLADLRRFGLVNVVALSLMIGLVVARGHANWRFAAFSALVTGYTAWAAWAYVFKQNWALAILLQDWSAPGYQAAMIFVSFLFLDWLFLRGWITRLVSSVSPGQSLGKGKSFPVPGLTRDLAGCRSGQ